MKNGFQKLEIQLTQDQAFQLSNPVQITYPTPTPLKIPMLSSLNRYFTPHNNIQNQTHHFFPIPTEYFLMANGNVIRLFHHFGTDNLQCQVLCDTILPFNIKQIKVSAKYKTQKNKEFFLIAESQCGYLGLLEYNSQNKIVKLVHKLSVPSVLCCWAFVNDIEIIVWCNNMKLYHYELNSKGLEFIQYLDTKINVREQVITESNLPKAQMHLKRHYSNNHQVLDEGKAYYSLQFCSILGQRGVQQQSIIVLFYILHNSEFNLTKIKCKEIKYPLLDHETQNEGFWFINLLRSRRSDYPKLLLCDKVYEIASHNAANPENLKAVAIQRNGDCFLAVFQFEIIVIQKKFNTQYFAIDNIYKKNRQCSVLMAHNSNIIFSLTSNIMEISRVEVGLKAKTRMIDYIDIGAQTVVAQQLLKKQIQNEGIEIIQNQKGIETRVLSLWVASRDDNEKHSSTIYFVYSFKYRQDSQEKEAFFLYMTKKTSKLKKIVAMAQMAANAQEIESIQGIGETLGISQSDFYFSMWKTSSKSAEDIYKYLLRCGVYQKILLQVREVLRKKTFAATKLQKIMHYLEESNLETLKKHLNEQNLMDYFHVIFVNRKIQIYQSNYEIDEKEFSDMVQISIYDLLQKIINQNIYPRLKNKNLWAVEPKTPPRLSLIQVFNLFKLPILEDYDLILIKILRNYSLSILKVLELFPELLPNYPFQNLLESQQKYTPTDTNLIKQKEFFSPVNNKKILQQSCFLDNILDKIAAYYPTSSIKKILGLTCQRTQIKGEKYKFHTIIETTRQQYSNKISELSRRNNGLYLYLVVLDCLIKSGYQDISESQSVNNQDPNETNFDQQNSSRMETALEELNKSLGSEVEEDQYYQIRKVCYWFGSHNHLPKDVANQLLTTSCLFQLMIEHYIIQIEQYKLWDFANEPIEKWIALFFLGNKQEKGLIFTSFMSIFRKQPDRFIIAMQNFIKSQHCSKVELSILIDMISNLGPDFQEQNQSIIQIILDGFSARIQISDVAEANSFKQRLSSIILGPQMLIKVDKIEKLAICRKILSIFYLEDIFLKDLLQNTIEIINQMLQNFLQGKIRSSSSIKLAVTQKKIINVQVINVKDIFIILHYLQENVLFHLDAEIILKTYCQKLLEWKKFDEVSTLLYDSNYVKDYGIDLHALIVEIQSKIFEKMHSMEIFSYVLTDNKEYVNRILHLDRGEPLNNPVVIAEQAKMAISDIFQSWQCPLQSKMIEQMCERWSRQNNLQKQDRNEESKPDLMEVIIEKYPMHLNVHLLENLCFYFTMATTKNPSPQTRDEKFYRYCTSLCNALLVHKKYKQACEIICIVNQVFQMNYSLMSECMIKSLIQKFAPDEVNEQQYQNQEEEQKQLDQGQKLDYSGVIQPLQSIENVSININICNEQLMSEKKQIFPNFFSNGADNDLESEQCSEQSINWIEAVKMHINLFIESWRTGDEDVISEIFNSFFSKDIGEVNFNDIMVHPDLCFNKNGNYNKFEVRYLWEILFNITSNGSFKNQDLIYAYFFMYMGLVEPSLGLEDIDYIGYNHTTLVTIMEKFMHVCERDSIKYKIMFLDYSAIFQKYLDSLTKMLVLRNYVDPNKEQGIDNQVNSSIFENVNFNAVREEILKRGLYKNDELTLCIQKLRGISIQAKQKCRKRCNKFNLNSTVKIFNLSEKMKMTSRKTRKTINKQVQMLKNQYDLQIKDQENRNEDSTAERQMFSFDQFKRIKIKIKNDESFSMNDFSEKQIIEQMIGFGDFNQKRSNLKKNKKNVEILQELIEHSRRQLQCSQRLQEEQASNYLGKLLLKPEKR